MKRLGLIVGIIAVVCIAGIAALARLGSEVDMSSLDEAGEDAPAMAEAPKPADMAEEPAAGDPIGSGVPPDAGQGAPPPVPLPPAAAGDPPELPKKNGHSGSKVISYFQHTRTTLDTARAFGFVLLPKAAVTDAEKATHKAFCKLVLASLDFMTPGAVADSAPAEVLATYWPVVASRESFEINDAFRSRNCDDLLVWYDHSLARKLATKAGVADLSGPLLITWPSGTDETAVRDPLIVDFSKANHERAAKALNYWFRQLKNRPELWTNRIREGTIRAELADAVNDTAGVVLAVMSGKWESLKTVATP
jgi:hypothetical protein